MGALALFLVGLVLIPLSITFFSFGDPILIFLILGIFLYPRPVTLLGYSVFFGLLLDLFNPMFGTHVIAYPCIAMLAYFLSTSFLTNRSVMSLLLMLCVSSVLSLIIQELSPLLLSLIIHEPRLPINGWSLLSHFFIDTPLNAVIGVSLFAVINRTKYHGAYLTS